MPATALANVRVFDGEKLTPPRTVVFENGLISEAETIPVGSEVVDGGGGTLLPGLIDAHVHLHGVENLQQAAHWGVTTMLDMGTHPPELVRSLRNLPGLTQIQSPNSPASAPGGMQTTRMGFDPSTAVTGPDDAERFVADRVAEGSDYIKIIVENPAIMGSAALDEPTVAAIVRAAHARSLRVIAHVTTIPAFEIATAAGVDVLTHAPLDAPVGPDLLAEIVGKKMISVPTLVMMQGTAAARAKMPTHGASVDYRNAALSVTEMYRVGVPVLAGTDANAAPSAPFNVRHGEGLHDELALLVAAGLPPTEALRGATGLAAQRFKLKDRGIIAPNLRADLLLVEGDPTADITATRNIRGVWIGGVRVR